MAALITIMLARRRRWFGQARFMEGALVAIPAENKQDGPMRLPREPEDATDLEEAEHWRNTYQELTVGFAQIVESEAGTHRRKRAIQVQRLRDRAAFWSRRYVDLMSQSVPSGGPGTSKRVDPGEERGR
jgi:hypothetical protein